MTSAAKRAFMAAPLRITRTAPFASRTLPTVEPHQNTDHPAPNAMTYLVCPDSWEPWSSTLPKLHELSCANINNGLLEVIQARVSSQHLLASHITAVSLRTVAAIYGHRHITAEIGLLSTFSFR